MATTLFDGATRYRHGWIRRIGGNDGDMRGTLRSALINASLVAALLGCLGYVSEMDYRDAAVVASQTINNGGSNVCK